MIRCVLGLAAMLAVAGAALAEPLPVTTGPLEIAGPWIRLPPKGAMVAAGYVRITNKGAEADRLVGFSVPIAGTASVHEMRMDDGVMKMRALPDGLAVPPGQSVELKPGSYHLMLEKLSAELKPGEVVKGTLTFAKAGPVTVDFTVAAGPPAATAP